MVFKLSSPADFARVPCVGGVELRLKLLVQLAALLGGLESMLGAQRVLDVVCCFMTLHCSSSGFQRPYGEVLVQPGESAVYLGAGNPLCPETLCCPLIFLEFGVLLWFVLLRNKGKDS